MRHLGRFHTVLGLVCDISTAGEATGRRIVGSGGRSGARRLRALLIVVDNLIGLEKLVLGQESQICGRGLHGDSRHRGRLLFLGVFTYVQARGARVRTGLGLGTVLLLAALASGVVAAASGSSLGDSGRINHRARLAEAAAGALGLAGAGAVSSGRLLLTKHFIRVVSRRHESSPGSGP